jgi:hypothetical protein
MSGDLFSRLTAKKPSLGGSTGAFCLPVILEYTGNTEKY